ncbi:MAG: hypothetical protein IJD28_08470 [Deferribacterales bacterium]|nr:hypothetical protein [Deferribacterales bacterium]
MKKLFILFIVFTSLAHYANAMSNSKSYNGILPNGMTSYQIRIMGGNWLNFQGIVAFYDKDGKPKTQRIFGNTPYIIDIQSKEGLSAYFRVSNIQPENNFGGILRVLLFKGDVFESEQRGFITNDGISISYGKYPDINLEFMVPPVGIY